MQLFTLYEDRTQGFIHLLRGSKVPIKKQTDDSIAIGNDSIDDFEFVPDMTIGSLPTEILNMIIMKADNVLEPKLVKYKEYVIQQIANGNLPIDKITEDAGRFNQIVGLFQKLSRKALWKGPKNIFGYENWKQLESLVIKLAREYNLHDKEKSEDGSDVKDGTLLFKKTYQTGHVDVLNALFGESNPLQTKTFYLRKINTPEGACKYGKGTKWCTSVTLPQKFIDEQYINKWYSTKAKILGHVLAHFAGEVGIASRTSLLSVLLTTWNIGIDEDGRIAFAGEAHNKRQIQDSNDPMMVKMAKSVDDYLSGKSDVVMNPEYAKGTASTYLRGGGLFIIELENENGRRPIMQFADSQAKMDQDWEVLKFGTQLTDFIKSAAAAATDESIKKKLLDIIR